MAGLRHKRAIDLLANDKTIQQWKGTQHLGRWVAVRWQLFCWGICNSYPGLGTTQTVCNDAGTALRGMISLNNLAEQASKSGGYQGLMDSDSGSSTPRQPQFEPQPKSRFFGADEQVWRAQAYCHSLLSLSIRCFNCCAVPLSGTLPACVVRFLRIGILLLIMTN